MAQRANNGFTLIEMLVVVAIIGVLIAVAIPTFAIVLDDAKLRTDQANMRSAAAAATYAYQTGGKSGIVHYYYDGTGEVIETEPANGYGQTTRSLEASDRVLDIPAYGTPAGSALSLYVNASGVLLMQWGAAGALYEVTSSNLSDRNVDLKSVSEEERQLADADGIKRLASTFLGKTKAEMEAEFDNDVTKNGTRVFGYNSNKDESVVVRGKNAEEYLRALGYTGDIGEPFDSYGQTCVRTTGRVFFSSYMATNGSGQDRKLNLKVSCTDGVVTSVTMTVTNQGGVTDIVPEAYRTITVSS